jgi:SAM-dependent methyltransferase
VASRPRRLFNLTVKPLYVGARGTAGRLVDRLYGIRTVGEVELAELGLDATDRSRYKASEWTTLRRILPRREVDPADVFVDFGSGLGRVVFQAARYRFHRVIGVELSEELNRVARQNVERNRHRLRCADVELVTADAVEYEIPDDVTVAYFANPFTGWVFTSVVGHLLDSVDRAPRRLRLIYRNPVEHDALLATGRFRVVRRLRGWRPGREWSRSNSTRMYEAVPIPR